jgi:hypothetical protein
MLSTVWGSFVLLVLLSIPMIYLPRFLQREIQAVFLLITRQPDISMALFSLLFLPGVLLHESSHFIAARILGVSTGKFSIIPRKMEGGRILLGYVETASTDFFRDALIGAAPLISGGIFVALAGVYWLGLNTIWLSIIQGQLSTINLDIQSMMNRPDFWLWFYLIFTVSSTMMPSAADQRAWKPLIAVMLVLIVVILLIGIGPWIMSHFELAFITVLNSIAMVFSITIIFHLILLPPTYLVRKVISHATGLKVV